MDPTHSLSWMPASCRACPGAWPTVPNLFDRNTIQFSYHRTGAAFGLALLWLPPHKLMWRIRPVSSRTSGSGWKINSLVIFPYIQTSWIHGLIPFQQRLMLPELAVWSDAYNTNWDKPASTLKFPRSHSGLAGEFQLLGKGLKALSWAFDSGQG